jgi:hypothetical protein
LKSLLYITCFALATFCILYPVIKTNFESTDFKIIHARYTSDEQGVIARTKQYFRQVPLIRTTHSQVTKAYKTNKSTLFRIDDSFYGVPRHAYYLFKNGKISEFMHTNIVLKAMKDYNLSEKDALVRYKELVIDIEKFNEIFSELNAHDKMLKYFELLRTSDSPETFEVIRSSSEVNSILKKWPATNNTFLNENLIISNYEFLDSLDSNQQALWMFDSGIDVFSFSFNRNNTLESVSVEFKGYLGNEVVHL